MKTISPQLVTRVVELSEGNPGALNVLMQLIQAAGDTMEAEYAVSAVDFAGLRGSAIWIAYKDECREDLARFINTTVAAVLDKKAEASR